MARKKSKKRRIAPVVYVTGKGGSGKSFVATALGRAAVARGLRVAVVTRRSGAGEPAREPTETEPRAERILWTPHEALGRLLVQTVRFRFLADRLLDSSTFTAVADAAPGVGDIAFLALIDEIARGGNARDRYDLVVVDAPASGHSAKVLSSPRYVAAIAAVGPAAAIVARISDLVTSAARFRPVIVCPPEELAVVETLAMLDRMRDEGVAPAVVAANPTYPAPGNEPQMRWLREHESGQDAALFLARFDRQARLLERLRTEIPALCEIPRDFSEAPDGDRRPDEGREDDFETPAEGVARLLDTVFPRSPAPRAERRRA